MMSTLIILKVIQNFQFLVPYFTPKRSIINWSLDDVHLLRMTSVTVAKCFVCSHTVGNPVVDPVVTNSQRVTIWAKLSIALVGQVQTPE